MNPAWAAPAAGSADTLAAPRTPASSPPSAGRSQSAAPLPAGSAPPRTPLVEPARIVPPASSLRPPLPLTGKWAIAAGFLLRCNRSIRLIREGFSLRCLQPPQDSIGHLCDGHAAGACRLPHQGIDAIAAPTDFTPGLG